MNKTLRTILCTSSVLLLGLVGSDLTASANQTNSISNPQQVLSFSGQSKLPVRNQNTVARKTPNNSRVNKVNHIVNLSKTPRVKVNRVRTASKRRTKTTHKSNLLYGSFPNDKYNRQYQARQDERNTALSKHDSKYWINRVNIAGYYRRNYHYPDINWNVRDLGNYPSVYGGYVKADKIFRGGTLHNINNKGTRELKNLHINSVIDLRSNQYQGGTDPNELHPHKWNKLGVTYHHYIVNTKAQKFALNRRLPYKPTRERTKYGTSFCTWLTARRAYNNVFKELLRHKRGAVYFHCIEGRDRTGIVSALVLGALGVSKYHIYNDFMLSNYYKYKYAYSDQAKELDNFYDSMRKNYGSLNNYLHKGLWLSNYQLKKLRKIYLTPRKTYY